MIQQESQLNVADNTGVKRVKCIKVLGAAKEDMPNVGMSLFALYAKPPPEQYF